MSRQICQQCSYPLVTCICDFIKPFSHKTKVVVLQHPSEVNNAKNTVRLFSLVSDNVEVYIGESESDFLQLKQELMANIQSCVLLYPETNTDSGIMDNTAPQVTNTTNVSHLVVIDGTWKKAKKLLLLNPWLLKLNKVSIDNIESVYKIRQTSQTNSLSSIEAIAYGLKKIEQTDVQPLIQLLNNFNNTFMRLMPDNVKKRY